MKLYRESMRRMSRAGLALLVISVVMTAILCISSANASVRLNDMFTLLPTLPYFSFLGGLAFAYTGFSFLNKRSDSDFFHSLPVRRVELYLSTTLAALTWTVITVLLTVLCSAVVYLFMATPFVPAYYPLGLLYFIAATMLVFAAAAIACSITGTLFTNVILTGIVLLLPRFILFMLGRSIVANTGIVGYWDLTGLMNPCSNAATSMLVYTRRTFLYDRMFHAGNSLYSLGLAAVELGIGGLLFTKRPSELAERGAVSARMQTLFACLLTLPVMLLTLRYTLAIRKLTIAILLVASLAIFVAYQLIVLRSGKRLLKTLPWYLCTALLAAGVFFGVRAASVSIRNFAPDASEIQSVQFGKPEPEYSQASYNTLLVGRVKFTEDGVKALVAQSLKDAVKRLQEAESKNTAYINRTFEPNATNTIVPIIVRLNNGRTVRRTIEFTNLNLLNEARNANSEYAAAIRAFPGTKNACHSDGAQGSGENVALDNVKLRESLSEEIAAGGLIADSYYEVQKARDYSRTRYYYFTENEDQSVGSFMINGYAGAHRFTQYYEIDLHMPKTAALWMQLSNQAGLPDSVRRATALLGEVRAAANSSKEMYIQLTFTNVPTRDGSKIQISRSYNAYFHEGKEQAGEAAKKYIDEMLAILARATPTTDPNALWIGVGWEMYDQNAEMQSARVTTYLACSAEDNAKLIKLLSDWYEADAAQDRIYGNDVEAPELAMTAE